jgi:hypothetical protein
MSEEAVRWIVEALEDVRDMRSRLTDLVEERDQVDSVAFGNLAYNFALMERALLQSVEGELDKALEVLSEDPR